MQATTSKRTPPRGGGITAYGALTKDLLERLPDMHLSEIDTLLPANWRPATAAHDRNSWPRESLINEQSLAPGAPWSAYG